MYQQLSPNGLDWEIVEKCGKELSLHLPCKIVRYVAYQYDKRILECKCGIVFPIFLVQGAVESKNWTQVDARHEGKI